MGSVPLVLLRPYYQFLVHAYIYRKLIITYYFSYSLSILDLGLGELNIGTFQLSQFKVPSVCQLPV